MAVMELVDGGGNVAGYSVGTADELSLIPPVMWSTTSDPGTALGALKKHMIGVVQGIRQDAEEKGVMVYGVSFTTDVASQIKYVGILVYASMDRGYTGTWKTATGDFITMNAADIVVMAMHVMAYIQVCFAWEQYVLAQIRAATTVQQLQDIDLESGVPDGELPPEVLQGVMQAAASLGSGLVQGDKFRGSSGIPSIVAGSAAGTMATVGLDGESTDCAGQISVVASGDIDSNTGAVIATVTFHSAYSTPPFVVITAANSTAGAVANLPFVSVTQNGFSLCVSNGAGLGAGMPHLFNYVVVQ